MNGSARYWRRPVVIILSLVAGLSACASFQSHPLDTGAALSAFETRTLDDPGLREFVQRNFTQQTAAWPPPSWNFSLLTLVADYYHADLRVAQEKLAATEAALITAGARPNPTVSFSPSYEITASNGISPWTLGFSLDVPIETAGKRGLRIAQARHLANAARLNLAATAWGLRSRVRKGLLDVQTTRWAQAALTRQQAAQTQAVDLLEARLKAGESSFTEVQLVRVAAAQTALQVGDAQAQSAQARLRLADALGVPERALADVTLSFSEVNLLPAPEAAAPARRDALLNRPDVLAALADYDASQVALQLEIAKQYPDIHLGPGYSSGYVADQLEKQLSLGVSLTLPIFNHNQGPIAEAESHRREAAATFASVLARAAEGLDQAVAAYRDALGKLATADTLLKEQRRRLTSAQAFFAAGATDRVELLQTQIEFGTNELSRTQALNDAQRALGQLEDAMERSAGATRAPGVPVSLFNHKAE